MLVRHCVEAANVNEHSFVIDPLKIRHVTVEAGKIGDMSSFIDPATHLNIDFETHKADRCVIAEKFEKDATVRFSDQGLDFASVHQTAFKHLGSVDYTQRLFDMRESIKKKRESKTQQEKT
jgi:hypothetical protein